MDEQLDDVGLLCHENIEEEFHIVRFRFGFTLFEFSCSSNYTKHQLAQELRAFADSVDYGIEGCIH